ncbi:hypothetical protein FA15DRAFT_683720 [Coprinopsis marcescibilis]|uniref:Uncharacterized protein n=1 Tax=Coprinopsis marcescibilis TaxID=230819 RepID=A0A5C3LC34_COPMA|nr:hypothetical protein FA15DRAFT_683720 [Coprinopsis marcescibilis]
MSDPRFSRLKTDPRFRQLNKKKHKVVIDDRFKSVLKQGKKTDKVKRRVDKYGRTLSTTHEEDTLKRFYRLENDEDEEDTPAKPDYARGEVLMESSDEEEDEDVKTKQGDESDSDAGGFVTLGDESDRESEEDEDELAEIDLDETTITALDAQAQSYSQQNLHQDDTDEAPRTRRLAVVNLDWDHVRASHLYKICSSLVSPTALPAQSSKTKIEASGSRDRSLKQARQVNVVRGKVLSVVVYPSDFGKERMVREETEGPPPEIFKSFKKDDEITEKSLYELGGEDEVDEKALRRYQLERLRYYYAIVTCDSVEAASHIYDELQGTELERSANVFDLSFVPEDMAFENEPRDEAREETATIAKPLDFVTDALRHSKVKLTWDEDDPERHQVTRRKLTKQEIEDGDFRAYIASSSDESEIEADPSSSKRKQKKKNRDRLRNLLLGGNDEEMPEGWGEDAEGADVDMEITFTPGLTGKPVGEETTLEKYQRKMKEKRRKRKDEVKEKEKGGSKAGKDDKSEDQDEFFDAPSDSESDVEKLPAATKSGKAKGKGRHKQDSDEEQVDSNRREATAEELALLVGADKRASEPNHFDFKAVVKAEKEKSQKKKYKKAKATQESNELQEDFVIDVQDDRFKMLHESHEFAIDPSNPHFKKTKGMSALLEERRKHFYSRNSGIGEGDASTKKLSKATDNVLLEKLVESVKRKTVDSHNHGQGKRRKL